MNNESSTICSNNECCSSDLAEHESTTVRTVQPVWKAEKTGEGINLEITLPGVSKDNLELKVQGHDLRLTAKRPSAADPGTLVVGQEAPEAYALKLRLGESLDGNELNASLRDGLLSISVPLAEAARSRTVTID